MNRLPYELEVLIWEMDPAKRERFHRVVHQLRMRNVFWQIFRHGYEPWLELVPMPEYDREGHMETMVDALVKERCKRHRVLGNRSHLPFDEFCLLASRSCLSNVSI
jgi:hypothetical protein